MKKVAIVMGSLSDKPIIQKAADMLTKLHIPFDIRVLSAHRTPEETIEFAKNAREDNYAVILAAAGKAAHLGGVIAAYTTLPVIGIPIKASALDGMDALLSIVQMPAGIPVASVAIDGAVNAALMAAEIFAIYNEDIEKRLIRYRSEMKEDVLNADRELINERI